MTMEVGVGERGVGRIRNERENQGGEGKGRAIGGEAKGMGVITDGGESQERGKTEG